MPARSTHCQPVWKHQKTQRWWWAAAVKSAPQHCRLVWRSEGSWHLWGQEHDTSAVSSSGDNQKQSDVVPRCMQPNNRLSRAGAIADRLLQAGMAPHPIDRHPPHTPKDLPARPCTPKKTNPESSFIRKTFANLHQLALRIWLLVCMRLFMVPTGLVCSAHHGSAGTVLFLPHQILDCAVTKLVQLPVQGGG